MPELNYEDKMREAVAEISKWGLQYAEYKPIADNLDNIKKIVLSEVMLQNADEAAWKAEARARASDVYKTVCAGHFEANSKANVAWAKLEASKAKFEAVRSLLSYTKTQMKTFQE